MLDSYFQQSIQPVKQLYTLFNAPIRDLEHAQIIKEKANSYMASRQSLKKKLLASQDHLTSA